MSQAADIISALKTALDAIQAVVTIVDSNSDLDMEDYVASDLPLIQIAVVREWPEYTKSGSGFAMWHLLLGLTCYFLDDIAVTSQRDNLLKQVKDVLGQSSELSGNSVAITIQNEVVIGEFPLWKVMFEADVTYERRVDEA